MIRSAEIIRALQDGDVSNLSVARLLGCPPERVRLVRKAAGIAPYRRGRRGSRETWKAAFAARTIAVDGGHLHWTGSVSTSGTPTLRLRSRVATGYRVAFRLEYGRAPVGKVLHAPGCEYPRCVAGAHLEDRLLREARYRAEVGA